MLLPRLICPNQMPFCHISTQQHAMLLVIAASLSVFGCGKADQILSYQVPKAESLLVDNQVAREQPKTETRPARMLVAMLPQETKVWFFKLVGPVDEVAELKSAFTDFIDTVRFENIEPIWRLPENWQESLAANAFRYKTINIPNKNEDKLLEIAVSNLGSDFGANREFLLPNLNRWRGQLNLPAVTMAELDEHIEKSEANGIIRIMIDLTGEQSTNPRPPFASGKGVN